MINRQDVLMGLVCCSESSGYGCNWCPYGGECRETTLSGCRHLCADALELLEKQEPMAPVYDQLLTQEIPRCGKCGYRLVKGEDKYCCKCGQAAKWND